MEPLRGLAPRIYEGGATSSQTGGGGRPYLRPNISKELHTGSEWLCFLLNVFIGIQFQENSV